jgi:nickel/cobalt exporter
MRKFFILISLFFVLNSVIAQDNPFLSKEKSNYERKERRNTLRYPRFAQKIFAKIALIQRSLNKRIAESTKKIKETKSMKLLFLIIFITFIYGVVHALGPGHGKTLTFSYFLSEETNVKKGIAVGCIIGFLHATSALTLVLILYFTIKRAYFHNIESMSRTIKIISYSLIAGIGLLLLIKNIYDTKRRKNTKEKGFEALNSRKSLIPFSFAVGLIPCTGATIVLLFSLSLGVLKIGIISTIFMAFGMATTISSVGILTILAKDSCKRILSKRSKLSFIIQKIFSFGGAFLIFALGVILLLGVYIK